MAAWRNLGMWAIILVAAGPGWAQTYSLTENTQPDDSFAIRLDMKLAGEWHIQRDDKAVPIRLTARASHEYRERVLVVGANGLPAKTARYYQHAQVTIEAGKHPSERTLRPERRLIIAQWHKDHGLSYCPDGALTREELETIEHFDTLHVAGLLPSKAVPVGDTWKVANPVAQALCSFDGLIEQDLSCKLESVQGDEARIAVTGSASGINLGAMAKLTITATATHSLKLQRLTALEWKQKEARDQGPASPATTIEATWTLRRTVLDEEPKEVSDVALNNVPKGDEPPGSCLQLCHPDAKQRFQLNYDRDWQMAGQTADHLVLRLLDRGDWVAQATVTSWTKADAGKHMSPEEFRDAMADTPGWEPDEVRDDAEVHSEKGHWVYRVSALGDMDGMKVLQNFYLVAGPGGDQVVVAVTLRPALAEKLGTRDLKLIDGLDFAVKAKETEKKE